MKLEEKPRKTLTKRAWIRIIALILAALLAATTGLGAFLSLRPSIDPPSDWEEYPVFDAETMIRSVPESTTESMRNGVML